MAPRFVISLDFELMWGVRDHAGVADYGDAVLGARAAIPLILRRFEAHGIRATWATVGLLFARNRIEMMDFAPQLRPAYADMRLSPYAAIANDIGENEAADPLHFGRSLIDRVADTEGQEIATHTYAHFCCQERGATPEAFGADLASAVAIMGQAGHRPVSIVFPRNQMSGPHLEQCLSHGITCFRSNAKGFAYRSRPGSGNSALVRGVRLLDSVMPLTGQQAFGRCGVRQGLCAVPASRFLRPHQPRLSIFGRLHVARILQEMAIAARRGESYHLWWHPHNMGRNTADNLAQLDRILEAFVRLRDSHGMVSARMADVARADAVRARPRAG